MLVRDDIWQKQNQKHPEQFWYFSSQIVTLEKMINLYSDYEKNKIKTLSKEAELQACTNALAELSSTKTVRARSFALKTIKTLKIK